MKPIDVLVERGGDAEAVASRLRAVPGIVGASVIWQDGPDAMVEAFPAIDGAAPGIEAILDRSDGGARAAPTRP